ncbi:MAG: flavodoxin-dependent (E)-4-hydroxy-3-methylbut-2-enyl-diphosphate synthase [Thermoleophilia bacterium]|nr:flavodoxin-dependent (E)-4-hydroxy-3-methylbut-2-enyl-diphosphate synthase [Thermoleophilia bacterium]
MASVAGRLQVDVGGVLVGGGAPVVVQSMTNTRTDDVEGTLGQIRALATAGAKIVRVAVPDQAAAEAVASLVLQSPVPLIADIHFDHALAVAALEAGAAGVRINPGNIGGLEELRAVVDAARERGAVIRVGVNSGSLQRDLRGLEKRDPAGALVESAVRYCALLEDLDFARIKVSAKSSSPLVTIAANRGLAEKVPYPLHLGVTEAGTRWAGSIRSAVALGVLLEEGIGDTIRVSLTGDPVEEVRVAFEILRTLGLAPRGPRVISCPTCGRTRIDLEPLALEVEKRLEELGLDLEVAVMGCVVNGPGEARKADFGIAGGDGEGIVFSQGRPVRKVAQADLVEALFDEIALRRQGLVDC